MCTLSKDNKKFSYSTLDLNNCLNFKRKLDKTNISKKNFDVSRKYISYLKDIKNFTNIDIGNKLKKKFFLNMKKYNFTKNSILKIINEVKITDVHTHLFPWNDKRYFLSGLKELLNYHYLTTEF